MRNEALLLFDQWFDLCRWKQRDICSTKQNYDSISKRSQIMKKKQGKEKEIKNRWKMDAWRRDQWSCWAVACCQQKYKPPERSVVKESVIWWIMNGNGDQAGFSFSSASSSSECSRVADVWRPSRLSEPCASRILFDEYCSEGAQWQSAKFCQWTDGWRGAEWMEGALWSQVSLMRFSLAETRPQGQELHHRRPACQVSLPGRVGSWQALFYGFS